MTMRTSVGVAPNGWVWEILSQHTATDPYLFDQYDYKIWKSQKSKDNGDEFHIWNNHKSQFRETHQRIVVGDNKGVLWQPDKTQPPVEIIDFAEFERTGQALKYKSETTPSKVEWEALDGKKVAPFVFPTYHGVDEPLDPQFVREQHIVTMESQREQAILEYIARAAADGRSGDLRGTTLNLFVAGATSDSDNSVLGFDNSSSIISYGNAGFGELHDSQYRFTGANFPDAATINSAVFTVRTASDNSSSGCNIRYGFEAADAPAVIADAADFATRAALLTTNTITVSGVEAYSGSNDYNSPDLKTSLQNISDRAGYDNDKLNLFVKNNVSSSEGLRQIKSYDSSSSLCGRLAIDYTAGGGGGPTVKTLAALGVG